MIALLKSVNGKKKVKICLVRNLEEKNEKKKKIGAS